MRHQNLGSVEADGKVVARYSWAIQQRGVRRPAAQYTGGLSRNQNLLSFVS